MQVFAKFLILEQFFKVALYPRLAYIQLHTVKGIFGQRNHYMI